MARERKSKTENTSNLMYLYIAAAVTVIVWLFVLSPVIEGLVQPRQAKHFSRWHSGKNVGSDPSGSKITSEVPAKIAVDSRYAGTAIVTLSGGDTSGRNCVALVQSLRDVGTVLPIIVLLARGGLGSAACSNQTWKRENNRADVRCGSENTIGETRMLLQAMCSLFCRCFWLIRLSIYSPLSVSVISLS